MPDRQACRPARGAHLCWARGLQRKLRSCGCQLQQRRQERQFACTELALRRLRCVMKQLKAPDNVSRHLLGMAPWQMDGHCKTHVTHVTPMRMAAVAMAT